MIKPVAQQDLVQCAQAIRKSFLTVANEFGFTEENAPRFTAFAICAEWLDYQLNTERRPMFVYFDDDQICGFYSLQKKEHGAWELNNLCVLPECRHKGIGRQLLEHAVKTVSELGCTVLKIGIVEENIRLRNWYEDAGFIHTGTKKYDHFPFTCGYMELPL